MLTHELFPIPVPYPAIPPSNAAPTSTTTSTSRKRRHGQLTTSTEHESSGRVVQAPAAITSADTATTTATATATSTWAHDASSGDAAAGSHRSKRHSRRRSHHGRKYVPRQSSCTIPMPDSPFASCRSAGQSPRDEESPVIRGECCKACRQGNPCPQQKLLSLTSPRSSACASPCSMTFSSPSSSPIPFAMPVSPHEDDLMYKRIKLTPLSKPPTLSRPTPSSCAPLEVTRIPAFHPLTGSISVPFPVPVPVPVPMSMTCSHSASTCTSTSTVAAAAHSSSLVTDYTQHYQRLLSICTQQILQILHWQQYQQQPQQQQQQQQQQEQQQQQQDPLLQSESLVQFLQQLFMQHVQAQQSQAHVQAQTQAPVQPQSMADMYMPITHQDELPPSVQSTKPHPLPPPHIRHPSQEQPSRSRTASPSNSKQLPYHEDAHQVFACPSRPGSVPLVQPKAISSMSLRGSIGSGSTSSSTSTLTTCPNSPGLWSSRSCDSFQSNPCDA